MSIKVFVKVGFVIFAIVLGHRSFFTKDPYEYELKEKSVDFLENETERTALEGFMNHYFIEDGFCRTNLKDTMQGDLASGEDVLSESVGLLMLYYMNQDDFQKFDRQVKILKNYFTNGNQLIQWRIRPGSKEETVNSTIDDLRIIKALILAADKWEQGEYKSFAKSLSSQLLLHCVSEQRLRAYDSENSTKAPFAYYDFQAMNLMGDFNEEWSQIAEINIKNILDQQVQNLPLYKDQWFPEQEGFPTVENLMIMMHLSEVGIRDGESMNWLGEQLKNQGLFGRYSAEGKPLNSVESPAIYALTARIAELNDDKDLYKLAINRLKGMQNLEANQYYGGFIDLNGLTAFSFDQLLSLLAYE